MLGVIYGAIKTKQTKVNSGLHIMFNNLKNTLVITKTIDYKIGARNR